MPQSIETRRLPKRRGRLVARRNFSRHDAAPAGSNRFASVRPVRGVAKVSEILIQSGSPREVESTRAGAELL
jgi:hypothetical protein